MKRTSITGPCTHAAVCIVLSGVPYGVWSLRAYLHGRNRNYSEAVSDFTHAIEINAKEPELRLDKGVLTAVDLLYNLGQIGLQWATIN
jgi:hypothetical protein